MPTWWIRRITLNPPSAYEERTTRDSNGTMAMTAGRPRTRAAGGVTLERDHPITVPEPIGLRNVLRHAAARLLAGGGAEEPLELLPRHRGHPADLRVLLDVGGRLHADQCCADA